jgi:mannitol/fructose-specific phosphotransferase system IIA component (Ntr-type)
VANLSLYLRADRVVVPLDACRKAEAIREVASTFEGCGEVPDFRRFLSALFRKESRFGSAVEKGVTIPHYRDESVAEPVIGIGVSREGVAWDRGERAHILVLIGWPDKHAQMYLNTVAELARVLHREKARSRLLEAEGAAEAVEVVLSELRETEGVAA